MRPGDGTALVRDFIHRAGIPASAIDMTDIAAGLGNINANALIDRETLDTATFLSDTPGAVPAIDPAVLHTTISAVASTPEFADLLAQIRNMVAHNLGATLTNHPADTTTNTDHDQGEQ